MKNEVDCQKVFQREFKGVQYIVTIKADADGLALQFENKYSGDVWESFYEPAYIEQITTKAGSHKKYNKFVDMAVKALPDNFVGDGYELFVDLLTHHDLEMQANRKSGQTSRTTDPKLINKRYLILSYISTYDKAHYPIPLEYISNPDPQRLKLTIRRLGQQIQYLQSNPSTSSLTKQLSALKHENQLIKSKLKASTHTRQDSKENQSNNLLGRELEEDNQRLREELEAVKNARDEEIKSKNKVIQEKDRKIGELEAKVNKYEQSSSQNQVYEQKFTELFNQVKELSSALQHSRENEKKSQLKITNLQKQLQKMMAQLKKAPTHSSKHSINSPRKSQNGSIKSNKSVHKLDNRSRSKKNQPLQKNSTVFESDTQSSKMRKANNSRVSPYRQSSRPLNTSNSGKKKEVQRINAISKYSNISNLYNKDRNRSRSRSKSRSVKKELSPPSNFQSSAVLTEGVDFGSDNEEDKVSETMARLRNHRNQKLQQQRTKIVREKKNTLNPIQQKISSIASMMKGFRNNSNSTAN